MESILLSIDPRDPLWIAVAFLFGFAVKQIGLPPLVGFLAAGFLLHAAGAEGGEFLAVTADLGVTLLLFTIGLKLQWRSLGSLEVGGVAIVHMALVTGIFALLFLWLGGFGIPMLADLDTDTAILVAFALSFSSTVFVVKILEEVGAMRSRSGGIAIGVLIVQDIAAVAFLAATTGKLPSLWAIGLLALIPLRHLLCGLLSRTGHGELLILYGIVLALSGADLFELVGLKGDLGALVVGILLANHPKANEMAKSLLGFKDLFLVGFFLSVGMTVLPGWHELLIALLLIVLLPLKVIVYFGLFTAFYLRTGTAWRASLTLANYSEFGLIVGTIAAQAGLLPEPWLAVFAIALSFSFVTASPLIRIRDRLYARWRPRIKQLERTRRLTGEENIDFTPARFVIFGMGRIGTAVYDALEKKYPGHLIGVDTDSRVVARHLGKGRQVVVGDPTHPDFWTRVGDSACHLEWILLATPSHTANLMAVERLREYEYPGRIASTSKYPEEVLALEGAGVHFAFNIYDEAGAGLAANLHLWTDEDSAEKT